MPRWLATFGLLFPLPSAAVLFVVDSAFDASDAVPGDGVCASMSDGSCTLRAAIMESNELPGADEIWLPTEQVATLGTFYVDLSQPDADTAAAGDLDVLEDLVLRRHPQHLGTMAHIARTSELVATPNRMFDVHAPARMTIADVSINHGYLTDPATSGAGMRIHAGAEARLDRCVFYANFGVARGIALAVHGTAVLRGCTVFDNGTAGTPEAIYVAPGAELDIEQATIHSNRTIGIAVEGPAAHASLRRLWMSGGENQLQVTDGGAALLENATIGHMEGNGSTLLALRGGTLDLIHVSSAALRLHADASGARVRIANSAVDVEDRGDCSGPTTAFESLGGNVFLQAAPCSLALQASDQVVDELRAIDVLADKPTAPTILLPGSETPAIAPLTRSPLLDAAETAFCPPLDQFGAIRPGRVSGGAQPRCDSGAIEGAADAIFGDGFE